MTLLRNILRSFYDFSFYKEVRTSWKGWAMGYTTGAFAILLAIGLTFGIAQLHRELVAPRDGGRPSVLEEGMRQIAAQWPHSTLIGNRLISDAPMPHIITVEGEALGERVDEPFITVDTTDTVNYATMTTPILFTSKELIIKKSDRRNVDETKIHSFDTLFKDVPQPMVLDTAKMHELVSMTMSGIHKHGWKVYLMVGLITWLVAIPFLLLMRVLLLIPLGVAGLLVAKFMGRELDYDSSVRVIAVTLIPLSCIEAFALIAFSSGVSIFIKVLVSLGVLAVLLKDEPKKA